MFRFFLQAVPLIVLLLLLFSVVMSSAELGPAGSLTVLSLKEASFRIVVGTWLLEAFGLVGLFLLVGGRSRLWWLDGLLAGWVAWIFRGPLLVVTIVVAAGKPQAPWFRLALGWWLLYTVCGLAMAALARRQAVAQEKRAEEREARERAAREALSAPSPEPQPETYDMSDASDMSDTSNDEPPDEPPTSEKPSEES